MHLENARGTPSVEKLGNIWWLVDTDLSRHDACIYSTAAAPLRLLCGLLTDVGLVVRRAWWLQVRTVSGKCLKFVCNQQPYDVSPI